VYENKESIDKMPDEKSGICARLKPILQKITDLEGQFRPNGGVGTCLVRELTATSKRSDLFARSAGFSLLIGDRPLGVRPLPEMYSASFPDGLTSEFSMTSCHYVQENKVAYNFWKKLENAYLIEYKRVDSRQKAAGFTASHYVIEKKMGYRFLGEPCRNWT